VSLHWQPVGPEPASTYWVRRALVLVAVLVVLYAAVALLTRGDGTQTLGQETPAPAATASGPPQSPPVASGDASPSAGASPRSSPSPSAPGAAVPCADTDLAVTAEAERDTYARGASPTLVLTVRNTSARPCRRDLGQGAAELLVTSGRDRIWSSDDCAPGGPPRPVVLAPQASDVIRVRWPATRSRPGCEGPKTPIEPGTYVVSGRIGELRTQGSAFRVVG
jgi:hypothetical protein